MSDDFNKWLWNLGKDEESEEVVKNENLLEDFCNNCDIAFIGDCDTCDNCLTYQKGDIDQYQWSLEHVRNGGKLINQQYFNLLGKLMWDITEVPPALSKDEWDTVVEEYLSVRYDQALDVVYKASLVPSGDMDGKKDFLGPYLENKKRDLEAVNRQYTVTTKNGLVGVDFSGPALVDTNHSRDCITCQQSFQPTEHLPLNCYDCYTKVWQQNGEEHRNNTIEAEYIEPDRMRAIARAYGANLIPYEQGGEGLRVGDVVSLPMDECIEAGDLQDIPEGLYSAFLNQSGFNELTPCFVTKESLKDPSMSYHYTLKDLVVGGEWYYQGSGLNQMCIVHPITQEILYIPEEGEEDNA